jgi:uncharacterized protein
LVKHTSAAGVYVLKNQVLGVDSETSRLKTQRKRIMTKTALITGASNGIGLELARIHARNGHNLILVARSIRKLNELKSELETKYKVRIINIEKDLSKPDAALEVFQETEKLKLNIDYLVNNAGFGFYGFFAETDWKTEEQMIQLNITALTHLTKLILPQMMARGSGRVMNVASVASFLPGPLMSVYYATKAYVLSFSEALHNEVKDKGMSVTALCPGPTASGFQDTAALKKIKMFDEKKMPTSREVAEYGFKAMMKGKPVAVHGISNKLMVASIRFTPRSIVTRLVRMIQQQ